MLLYRIMGRLLTARQLKQVKLATDFESNIRDKRRNCSIIQELTLGVLEMYTGNAYCRIRTCVLECEVSFDR